eukprot:Phypoly_transcript_12750.p1 GENE.Phypoly_transcript_12750~~Phypoly_transcript_12750.p1  ORF type:complete len:333 (+),score=8.96 Phypoly_transcript_12750:109-1107(+)
MPKLLPYVVVVLILVGLARGASQCPTIERFCLGPGANCSTTDDSQPCENKYFCNQTTNTCTPSTHIGQSCVNDTECIDNQIGVSLCWQGVCSLITLNQKEGQPCTTLQQCKTLFYCNNSGICSKLQTEGQSCTTIPCVTGFTCNFGVCIPVYKVNLGGRCEYNPDSEDYDTNMVCEPGLYCAPNNTCAKGFRSSNAPCDLENATSCVNPDERCTCALGNEYATCRSPRTFPKNASSDYLAFRQCVYDYNCIDTDPKCCHCEQCTMYHYEDKNYQDYLNGCYANAFHNCNRPQLTKAALIIIISVGVGSVVIIAAIVVFLKKYRQKQNYSPIS